MLRGDYKGQYLGSGSDTWKYWAELRAGNITKERLGDVEDGIARSPGHCMTMGTASTLTSAAEALGLTPPGGVDPARRRAPRADGHARPANALSTWCGRTLAARHPDQAVVRQRGDRRCWRSAARPTVVHLVAMASVPASA